MVFCMILGCGNSSQKQKGVYSKFPAVREREGPEEKARSEERQRLWLKAISRADLTEKKLKYERVCFRHFISGKFWVSV